MKLLILGGTRFFGRHLTETALARRHSVTLFNRGQSNPELFPEVEKLRGDRGGNLEALKGRHWDAAVDTCGFISATVRATAELLAGAVDHYTFVSSISVYHDLSRLEVDESAPLETLAEGVKEDENDPGTYGARKALCELAIEQSVPGHVLIVRPGVIVGPHDNTDRFSSWVRRVARGGDVAAPAPGEASVQLIDARDLSEWIIRMAESRKTGTYNAVGPAMPMNFSQMLEHCKSASGSDAHFVWIDERFLLRHKVKPFTELPFWIPQMATGHAGFFTINSRRALASGLALRPLTETARDILASDGAPTKHSDSKPIGLAPDRERELLEAWDAERRTIV